MSFILGSDLDLILSKLGADAKSFLKCGVTQPVITDPSKKPGDIDLLICDGGRPHESIALQCKRVKIRANQRMNKLETLQTQFFRPTDSERWDSIATTWQYSSSQMGDHALKTM